MRNELVRKSELIQVKGTKKKKSKGRQKMTLVDVRKKEKEKKTFK